MTATNLVASWLTGYISAWKQTMLQAADMYKSNQEYKPPARTMVEGDWSQAAFFLFSRRQAALRVSERSMV